MKVLFIAGGDLLKNYKSGGEQVCRRNIDCLCELYGKENIHFLFFSEWKGECPKNCNIFPRLRRWKVLLALFMGHKMYYPWNEKKILDRIRDISPDIIFFDGISIGSILPKIPDGIYTVVFEHNCERKFVRNQVRHEGIIYFPEFLVISACERIAVKECNLLICINERDRKDIHHLYSRTADLLLPVTFEGSLQKEKIVPNAKKELIFIGSNFKPNLEGIRWFVDNVMSVLEDYQLYIVGKNFEKERKKLERNNVTVVGTVENLEEYYYRYQVIVMPIFYGSGMKVKTAEAMMYGKTILATDEALEGYDTETVKGIFRCNTKEEFITCLHSLFAEDIPTFQEEVYQNYLNKYSRKAALEILSKAMPSGE